MKDCAGRPHFAIKTVLVMEQTNIDCGAIALGLAEIRAHRDCIRRCTTLIALCMSEVMRRRINR